MAFIQKRITCGSLVHCGFSQRAGVTIRGRCGSGCGNLRRRRRRAEGKVNHNRRGEVVLGEGPHRRDWCDRARDDGEPGDATCRARASSTSTGAAYFSQRRGSDSGGFEPQPSGRSYTRQATTFAGVALPPAGWRSL